MKCQRAEIQTPLLHFDGNLPGRHAPNVDRDVGITLPKPRDDRQQRVDGRLVRANEHAAAAQVAQIADRRLGFLGEPHQPLPVVLQHPAGLGERSGLRGSIEELLAQLQFETANGLADGGLRAVHLRCRPREAAFVCNREKDLQGTQFHSLCRAEYNMPLLSGNHYHFDF